MNPGGCGVVTCHMGHQLTPRRCSNARSVHSRRWTTVDRAPENTEGAL